VYRQTLDAAHVLSLLVSFSIAFSDGIMIEPILAFNMQIKSH
jgi:hypothetical protein